MFCKINQLSFHYDSYLLISFISDYFDDSERFVNKKKSVEHVGTEYFENRFVKIQI